VSNVLTAETLRQARWFGGKSRPISSTRSIDEACLTADAELRLVEVSYATGDPETYVVVDRFEDPHTARAVLAHFGGTTLETERGGRLVFRPTRIFHSVAPAEWEPIRPLRGEQSNTSILFGKALILKLFRRLQFGPNPDVEIGLFLTEQTTFRGTPPVAGSLTYVSSDGAHASLALLQQFEPNRGDAWTTTLVRVREVLDGRGMDASLGAARRLGATTAELHLALASGTDAFAAEPITRSDIHDWTALLEEEVQVALAALSRRGISVDKSALLRRAHGLSDLEGALKTRHHGDYHLGQVLERQDGAFVIIDFEGEPSRPLAQRREKRTPLRDVAGMLRSFDYARHAALRAAGGPASADRVAVASRWYTLAREAFLEAYLAVASRHPRLLPEHVEAPLAALELEKAAYEIMYELNNRPDWLPIPLAAFTPSEWRR
jgi:trehalose synthase-fused probable maltokinase